MQRFTALINRIKSKVKKTFTRSSYDYDLALGQVLIKKKIINRNQLQNALDAQIEQLKQFGKSVRIGQIIIEKGYITEEKLIQVINRYYNISVKSLSDDIQKLVKEKRSFFRKKIPSPILPIWLKLSIATVIIIITIVAALSLFILGREKEQLYRQTVKIGKVSLNYITNNAAILILNDNILQLNSMIKGTSSVDGLLYAVIINHDNLVMAHSNINKIDLPYENLGSLENASSEGDVIYSNSILPSGKRVLNMTRPIFFKDKLLGKVHVGVSIDFIEQINRKERNSIILLTLCFIPFGVIIAVLMGIRFSRPISRLVMATKEIGDGNYKYRIKMQRKDEIGKLAGAFNRMSEDLLKKSLMQESFGKYIGSEVLRMIMANPEHSWLKGKKNEATIVFADIRGFTAYSAHKDPEEIVNELNEYFEIVSRIVLDSGGYVDKFIGDAVLAVYGIPVYYDNHVGRAISAALEIQTMLKEASYISGNSLLKSIGIGIDSGLVVSGNIGSQIKMEYTVIGSCVNIASRLNGLAGPGEIIISKNVFMKLKNNIRAELRPPQKIKGISEPVETYKVLEILQ